MVDNNAFEMDEQQAPSSGVPEQLSNVVDDGH
jgi:hypothetical protein